MKKQKPWMALAWCVELEKAVTAYEALEMRVNQGKVLLTFNCLACERPLILGQIRRGFLSHPFFRRRSEESHASCIKDVYLPKEAKIWMNTVNDLRLVASKARKFKQALHILEVTPNTIWKSIPAKESDKGLPVLLVTRDLKVVQEAYAQLETAIINLEKGYLEGWLAYDR